MEPPAKTKQFNVILKEGSALAGHACPSLANRGSLDHDRPGLASQRACLNHYQRRWAFLRLLDLSFLGLRYSYTPKKSNYEYRVHPCHFAFHFSVSSSLPFGLRFLLL